MNKLLKVLLYVWQLPQNLLGLLVKAIYKEDFFLFYGGKRISVCTKVNGGVSLGETIIVGKYPFSKDQWNDVRHECGHAKQSLYLGPLYLIIVGIPSALWGLLYKQDPDNPNGYFKFYTEKWAEKLGNVQR